MAGQNGLPGCSEDYYAKLISNNPIQNDDATHLSLQVATDVHGIDLLRGQESICIIKISTTLQE